ncbi:Sucrase/ferredoxin-like-domain-containing protein [Hyaloraphidium curvatum]|nr:Sucrase/ferredoxin-like-domain-containing protein [Hyaloraphidium curvatum]
MRSLSLPPASLDSLLPGFLLSPSSFPGSLPLPYTHLVLVCIHARRDTRCGRIGPAVVAALKEVVEEKGLKVKVAGCSHVGGHKWAGNVIVYPGGDWFGRVLPHHAPALIEEYVGKGNLLKELWRGRIGEEA